MICKHDLPISAKCRACFTEAMANEAEIVTKGHKPKSRKAKTCKVCKQKFIPRRDMQSCCSYPAPCEAIKAEQNLAKKLERQQKQERLETKQKLEALEKYSVLEQRARKALQAYRREKDLADGFGCISCGKSGSSLSKALRGHAFDGGHYRAVGSAKHLSLEPRNIFAQCVYCNRDLNGNPIGFRAGLLERVGLEELERLEADNEPRHHSREDLIAMAPFYRKLTRELKK